MEVHIYLKKGKEVFQYTPSGWVSSAKERDVLKYVEKLNDKDFKKAEVHIDGKIKKFNSVGKLYSFLLEYWLDNSKKYLKNFKKLKEARALAARQIICLTSFILKKERYSPELHNAVQQAYSCRFYDVNIANAVCSEVERRKGSSRERLLKLLKLLDSNISEENVYDVLTRYMMLFPSLNADMVWNIHEVVFGKLELIQQYVDYIAFTKKKPKGSTHVMMNKKKINLVVEGDVIYLITPVREKEGAFIVKLRTKQLISPIKVMGKTVYLVAPEGFYWNGMFLGVDVDWYSLISEKAKRKQKKLNEWS